ncbi:MAG: methyltransferase domain-containing protein [Acidobacteriota bacterium]
MTRIKACRGCGGSDLHTILSLGEVPLANRLLTGPQRHEPEPRFPLTLLFCPSCSLVQIRETVDPETLFSHYLYFSSYSSTFLAHAAAAANLYRQQFHLGPGCLVVEIASNDGYMLRNFVAAGIPVLGIEPAANIAACARQLGVPTLTAFFDESLATRLVSERGPADLILAANVLAHVADIHGFVAGIARLLAKDGAAVIEVPDLCQMIKQSEFDTIYHEHLCYFSLHALCSLLRRHHLELFNMEHLPIHGGSLRLYLQHMSASRSPDPAVEKRLAWELRKGVAGLDYYRSFAASVDRLRADLLGELSRRKDAGQKLAAYGASAKGSTLMNSFGIGSETLAFVADRSPVKQGLYTPGNHLPVVDPAALGIRKPDAVLLLTWNFAAEILKQQTDYLKAGGAFIVPVPTVRTLDRGNIP